MMSTFKLSTPNNGTIENSPLQKTTLTKKCRQQIDKWSTVKNFL